MSLSPDVTSPALELLAEIRKTQSKTIQRMANDWRDLMKLEGRMDDLASAIVDFSSAASSEPTSPQVTGLRRDVQEFRQDMSALRVYLDKLANMTRDVKNNMADIKTTLDIVQSRFEESAV